MCNRVVIADRYPDFSHYGLTQPSTTISPATGIGLLHARRVLVPIFRRWGTN
jgi:hypothetical protein